MNKTKYNLRHVACNMEDFNKDRHRFRFEYNGKEYVVPCYGALDVIFDEVENEIPEDVLCEVQSIIFNKIDKEEKKWRYPLEAYEIANEYCKENYARENSEEVIVYTDCLNADNEGDLVRCSDCGELMLMQIGGTSCGECESENLIWYDENRPEWTIEELEEEGFIIVEK